jgi:hypothetical protein
VKLKQSQCWFGDTYQPGDIVGLQPGGWSRLEARTSELVFTPHTPLLHWFFIGKYISKEKDYVIYESIPSHGVAIGRLSFYDGQKYRVFRINKSNRDLGEFIIDEVSMFGRQQYGYPSILRMLAGIAVIEYASLRAIYRLKTVTARDMYVYMSNKGLLCTQLVHDVPLRLGIDILPPGDAALPCAFIEAIEVGILIDVTQLRR